MRSEFPSIGGIQKTSCNNFPGRLSCVCFLTGCNLRCPYCHNPGLVLPSDSDRHIGFDEVLIHLKHRHALIDGVVFTGGEPTIHSHLPNMVSAVRSLGFAVKIDTNGLLPDVVRASHPDYLALDIKTVPSRYAEMLGCPFGESETHGRLLESLSLVKSMNKNGEVRITIAPDIIDEVAIHRLIPMVSGVSKLFLQPMRQTTPLLDPAFEHQTVPDRSVLDEYRLLFSRHVEQCFLRQE